MHHAEFSYQITHHREFFHQSCITQKEVSALPIFSFSTNFFLYHNNVSSKIRTLAIQPQKSIGKYSKHFTPKMPIIGQNRSSDFKAYWEIWSASGRLLDNQAPDKPEKTRRVKRAWQGGILTFPDLSWLAPPTCYFLQI